MVSTPENRYLGFESAVEDENSGLEALRINKSVMNEGKEELMKFTSDYELNNNVLTISVNEFYKVLNLPKSKYDAFRDVVNSAADFNKVVLVLHPEPAE